MYICHALMKVLEVVSFLSLSSMGVLFQEVSLSVCTYAFEIAGTGNEHTVFIPFPRTSLHSSCSHSMAAGPMVHVLLPSELTSGKERWPSRERAVSFRLRQV